MHLIKHPRASPDKSQHREASLPEMPEVETDTEYDKAWKVNPLAYACEPTSARSTCPAFRVVSE